MRPSCVLAALLILLGLGPALAQTPGKVYRLAVLSPSPQTPEALRNVILPELAKRGFVEGRNLLVEIRTGTPDQLPNLARDLVTLKPDAIIAVSTAMLAAKAATSTVPIIAFGGDPVAVGLASNLSRPGANLTGVVILAAELDAKRLYLLHEALPRARRIAALFHPSVTVLRESQRELRSAAASTGVEPLFFDATGPENYPAAFAAMRAAGAQALVITANPWFFRDAGLLARRALEAGLPTVCEWAEMAAQGCLLGYGPRRAELYRRVADLAAHVFLGTPASELPVEQPAEFEFAINLKTAKALGIELPPSILARADEVIE